MTVFELRAHLMNMPSDAIVVVSGRDHSYVDAEAVLLKAKVEASPVKPRRRLSEPDPGMTPDALIDVLWIG